VWDTAPTARGGLDVWDTALSNRPPRFRPMNPRYTCTHNAFVTTLRSFGDFARSTHSAHALFSARAPGSNSNAPTHDRDSLLKSSPFPESFNYSVLSSGHVASRLERMIRMDKIDVSSKTRICDCSTSVIEDGELV
jgi:hypothetical protein